MSVHTFDRIEVAGTLLGFERHGEGRLLFSIDRDPVMGVDTSEHAMTDLSLVLTPAEAAEIYHPLHAGMVESGAREYPPYVSFAVAPADDGDGGYDVYLETDIGFFERQLHASAVLAHDREYTREELLEKCRWLRRRWERTDAERLQSQQDLWQLRSELLREIGQELVRSERKALFFSARSAEKEQRMRGRIDALRRIERRIVGAPAERPLPAQLQGAAAPPSGE